MVQFGFYIWPLVAFLMIFLILKNGVERKRLYITYGIIFFVWLVYIILVSQSGVLNAFSLPPRIPIFIVIPAIIGIVILTGRPIFKHTLQRTPLHIPVYLQSFRIVVELLIYGAFINGIIPKRATFEGLNFDILVGISALIIGYLVQQKKITPKGLLVWNIVSLLVLSGTFYSFVSGFYFSDFLTTVESIEFVKIPYIFLASVLLPTAIFLHVCSIRQIKMAKQQTSLEVERL